jgi:large subunit ribosomal protein L20
MTRVKGGVNALKTRRNVLKKVKGYRFGRSTKEAQAREAIVHAGTYAFAHRKDKKNDFRKLWNVKINAALRPLGQTYSKFIDILNKKNIEVDRKIMADMAENNPETFSRFVESAIK